MSNGKQQYLTTSDLCFSEIYGGGVYTFSRAFSADPLGSADDEAASPILTNILTGETFFARRFGGDDKSIARYRHRLLHPADQRCVVWPADMVALDDEQAEYFSLFVAHNYRALPAEHKLDRHALLFPCNGWPTVVSATERFADLDQLTWRDPQVRKLAANIVSAIEGVNRSGYIYCDIHPSRIFFKDDDSVLLDHSNLVYSLADTVAPDAAVVCSPTDGEYPIEFAEPAYVNRDERDGRCLDMQSQNYSLCAMLFYLFFGRYPYDGRLLDGAADDDPYSHYAKFQKYHSLPIFIFDPNDPQNALGTFAHEQQLMQLWQDLPQLLKDHFVSVLRKDSAMRADDCLAPSAGMWLQYLDQADWPT